MKKETIIQFVAFETTLDSTDFFTQWEQYKRSMDGQSNITLQQHTLKNGKFKYVSQHQCSPDEFQFVFQKEKRWSKFPEVEVRKKLAGGYSVLQREFVNETAVGESKILVFIDDYGADLDRSRRFCVHSKLNIYEAYYENCMFTYILEVFVKDEQAFDLLQQLETLSSFSEAGIYKELHVS